VTLTDNTELVRCIAILGASITAGSVVGLLIAEVRDSQFLRWAFKPLACVGFLMIAVAFASIQLFADDPTSSGYAALMVAGLVLCAAGDILLIPRSTGAAFRSGIFAFLAGHVVFSVSFFVRGVDIIWCGVTALALLPLARAVYKWLSPRIPEELAVPVLVYVIVISAMVSLAMGTFGANASWLILIGSTAFWLSDISVALDRFMDASLINRLWGIPFYFGAQVCLAWSIAG
jgi:uncharacterized membrane protein YhhN